MKKTTAFLILGLILLPALAVANDGAAIYTAKCKACHGPDGKKLAKADLTSEAIQVKAEGDLVKFLTTDAKHKTKVADEAAAKTVIAYIKTLK